MIEMTTSILLKEPFALKNLETVYLTSIFSTLSYSDIVLIDNFDLIIFYFNFVFENFGNNSVLTPESPINFDRVTPSLSTNDN